MVYFKLLYLLNNFNDIQAIINIIDHIIGIVNLL